MQSLSEVRSRLVAWARCHTDTSSVPLHMLTGHIHWETGCDIYLLSAYFLLPLVSDHRSIRLRCEFPLEPALKTSQQEQSGSRHSPTARGTDATAMLFSCANHASTLSLYSLQHLRVPLLSFWESPSPNTSQRNLLCGVMRSWRRCRWCVQGLGSRRWWHVLKNVRPPPLVDSWHRRHPAPPLHSGPCEGPAPWMLTSSQTQAASLSERSKQQLPFQRQRNCFVTHKVSHLWMAKRSLFSAHVGICTHLWAPAILSEQT